MNRLAENVSSIIRSFSERRRIRVGLIFNGNRAVAENVIACGQRTLVLSERFHPLYKLSKTFQTNGDGTGQVLMVEARLGAMPVTPQSLDVLVLSSGLPADSQANDVLVQLRGMLKPGGLLIWTHASNDGTLSRVFSGTSLRRKRAGGAGRRPDLCRMAMTAGFCEVGQSQVAQTFGNWVVTTGRRGRRPWEDPK